MAFRGTGDKAGACGGVTARQTSAPHQCMSVQSSPPADPLKPPDGPHTEAQHLRQALKLSPGGTPLDTFSRALSLFLEGPAVTEALS